MNQESPGVLGAGKLLSAALIVCLLVGWTPAAARAAGRKTAITGSVATSGGPVSVWVKGRAKTTGVSPNSGMFSLGFANLHGRHTLVFSQSGKRYRMPIRVPGGARLALRGVTLKADGTASAESEDLTLSGTMESVNCGATPPTLTVNTGSGTPTISFDPSTTYIVDQSTDTVITTCADLSALAPAPVEVEALVNPDGSLSATQIVVNPGSEFDSEDVEFHGTVNSNSGCSATPPSIVVTRDDGTNVSVNITPSTEIEIDDSGDGSATCTDLTVGMPVDVEGALQSDGSVNADNIEGEPTEFDSSGMIDSTNCAGTPQSLQFTPDGSSSPITVTISSSTEIEVNDGSATCADLTPGAAEVQGISQPDGSVAASQIDQSSDSGDGGGDSGGD